jgi:hypothetical protein
VVRTHVPHGHLDGLLAGAFGVELTAGSPSRHESTVTGLTAKAPGSMLVGCWADGEPGWAPGCCPPLL